MKEYYFVNIEFENNRVITKDYLISMEEIITLGSEIKKIDIIKITRFLNFRRIKYFAVIMNRKYIKQIFYNLQSKEDSERVPIYYSPCDNTEEVLENYNYYYEKILRKNIKVLKYAKKK